MATHTHTRTVTDTDDRIPMSGNAVIEDPTTKLHDRLRKLLVMSKQAATEAEAVTAAGLLQRFLTEHNLDIAQLESKGAAIPGVHEIAHDLGKAAFKWKLDLAEYIAEFYYCAAIVDRKSKTVAFVGRPDNVQSLQMLYAWIIDQIKRIANDERKVWMAANSDHMDPLRWQVNFGEGAAARLAVRLHELKSKQAEDMARDANGDVVALTLHHAAEVSDYLEDRYGYRTDGKMTRKERESEERWAAYYKRLEDEREALRRECEARGDMEPFYAKYPYLRPKTEAQLEAERREAEREAKRQAARDRRNEKRREERAFFGGSGRTRSAESERQEDQAWHARIAGRKAADKVNLQPFLGDGGSSKSKSKGSIR